MHTTCCLIFLNLVRLIFAVHAYDSELLRQVPPVNYSLATAQKTDISYYLYTDSDKLPVTLTPENVATSLLTKNRDTKVFIHGFTTDSTSPWFPLLKDAYFAKGSHNIIYTDWSKAGNLTYAVSSANVKPVGEFVADFFIASGIPLAKIHLISHSLGSHLAGFIGKSVFIKSGSKIGRVTALDPARPSFEGLEPHLRLSDQDADFVDVIHTDIDHYGYTRPVGHVDFYPNGGKSQPGCPPHKEDDNCSHARSTLFFIESVHTKVRTKAAVFNVETRAPVVINKSPEEVFFGDATRRSARGSFYFETNDNSPFLKK